MTSEPTGQVDGRGSGDTGGHLEAVMAYRAAMALGPLAPLLRCADVWGLVEGLEDLYPVLDLRLEELDLRTGAHDAAEGRRAGNRRSGPG